MSSINFGFNGAVAFVTGAGSGIGRAIALELSRSGAAVGCIDVTAAGAIETADSIRSIGGLALAATADVTDADQLDSAVFIVEHELGPLALAVNAAGIAGAAPAEEMTPGQWQRVIDIDLTGVFLSAQAEGRAMMRNGGGAIVNIASMSATIANRGLHQAHYNTAKAGVVHLGRSLAWEWAPHGIRVNSVSPGYTVTPMTERPEQADAMAGYAADTPLGRNAQPDDIAGPVAFLLSSAASYITGIDLLVDGGHVIW
ncbi:SDR family oxidoreductase [Microbacterium atlanticum]|uniref:SDR family oxidoreductase n=1 Tax=Microbacterium atlanticum TaxID=2782168 RepID=UPI0018888E85|nr:SDR family oxidoreductase [Microbacterium atlanticum]